MPPQQPQQPQQETQDKMQTLRRINLRLTNYPPFDESATNTPAKALMEGGKKDRSGKFLITLQNHIRDSKTYPYVSLSGDWRIWPWGQRIIIPELEKIFNNGKPIIFRVVDTGGHFFDGKSKIKGIKDPKKIFRPDPPRPPDGEPIDVCTDKNGDFSKLTPKVSAFVVIGDDFTNTKRRPSGPKVFKEDSPYLAPGSTGGAILAPTVSAPNAPNAGQAVDTRPAGNHFDTFLALYEIKAKEILNTVNSTIVTKGSTADVILPEDTFSLSSTNPQTQRNAGDFASFGYIFTTFMCPPLIRQGNFEELQVFFYAFNQNAGPVSGMNIAYFPIRIEEFAAKWAKILADQPISDMMSMNLNSFLHQVLVPSVQDPTSPVYANFGLYQVGKENLLEQKDNSKNPDIDKQIFARKMRIQAAFGPTTMPKIEIFFETIPGPVGKIARIHIYDAAADPFPSVAQLIADPNSSNLLSVKDMKILDQFAKQIVTDISQKEKANSNIAVQKAKEISTLSPLIFGQELNSKIQEASNKFITALGGDPNSNDVNLKLRKSSFGLLAAAEEAGIISTSKIRRGDPQGLKDYAARTMPYIRYGTQTSVIKSANIQSDSNSTLSTINIVKQRVGTNPTDPNNSDSGGFPIRVIPASLSMTTVGNPLLRAAQRFFIDFGTGTTIDNVFMIKELTHNISPGNFSTQITAVFTDGYPVLGTEGDILAHLEDLSNKISSELAGQATAAEAANTAAAKDVDAKNKTEITNKTLPEIPIPELGPHY